MTDRELIELAATAAGIVHEGWCSDTDLRCGLFIPMGHRTDALRPLWNPLAADGDAFRLAVTLGLAVSIEYQVDSTAVLWGPPTGNVREPHNGDPCAATRRAIVRAAAEIGKAMP